MKISKRAITSATNRLNVGDAVYVERANGRSPESGIITKIYNAPGSPYDSCTIRWPNGEISETFCKFCKKVVPGTAPVNAATSDENIERYLHALAGDISAMLSNDVDSITVDNDAAHLFVTVDYVDETQKYTFDLSELAMQWDSIGDDTAYIVNTVLHGLDNDDDIILD